MTDDLALILAEAEAAAARNGIVMILPEEAKRIVERCDRAETALRDELRYQQRIQCEQPWGPFMNGLLTGTIRRLTAALPASDEIRVVCMHCKAVLRDGDPAEVSHGLCDKCLAEHYPEETKP